MTLFVLTQYKVMKLSPHWNSVFGESWAMDTQIRLQNKPSFLVLWDSRCFFPWQEGRMEGGWKKKKWQRREESQRRMSLDNCQVSAVAMCVFLLSLLSCRHKPQSFKRQLTKDFKMVLPILMWRPDRLLMIPFCFERELQCSVPFLRELADFRLPQTPLLLQMQPMFIFFFKCLFHTVWQKNGVIAASSESPSPQEDVGLLTECILLKFLEVETQLKARCAIVYQRSGSLETKKQGRSQDLSSSSHFEVTFLFALEKAKFVMTHFHTKRRGSIVTDFLQGVESTYQFSEKCTFIQFQEISLAW